MKSLLNLSWIVICVTLVSCSRDKGSSQNGGDNDAGTGAGNSSVQGFASPDAALDAYGKALIDGDGAAYRKIAAKDTNAIKGLDAIVQFEKDKSPEEAAKINLQALAPMQGFGNAVVQRFPAEINGDNAVVVQLFEREIALKKEIHFRKFKFSKSGGKWHLVGSEFGEASTLPAKYAWNKEAEATVVGSSTGTPIPFIPQDALAAVVVHPKRAASSEIGQAFLKLDVVQAGLRQSQFKPDDIERIIYVTGIPTSESANDCTIVQFAKPVSRDELLKEEFGELAYDEVRFEGQAYYRAAGNNAVGDGSPLRPDATEQNRPTAVGKPKVLARYPDDRVSDENGHADSSDSGNWLYLSSDKQNPANSNAKLARLGWNPKQFRYEGNELRATRRWPAVGRSLAPALKGPQYPVLRWQSRTSAALRIHGTFKALPDAKSGDGVIVLVFVDGKQEFTMGVKRGDSIGVAFDVSASVKPGSTVDFVVDPKANVGYDSTLLDVTIEDTNASVESKKASPATGTVLAKYPDDKQPAANGHADSSGNGNWFYYSSRSQDPSDDSADLKELRWVGSKDRYESPRGAMGNIYPAIGGSLAPGPRPPKFAALRWKSRVSGGIVVRGNFHKFDTANQSDGVRVLVFVNGEQKFAEDVAKKDTVGVNFEIAASVDPDSFVDFVVDPKGRSSDDSTKLTVTIESRGESGSKPAVEVVETLEPKERLVDGGTAVLLGTSVYFPDDKTMVTTNEQQLRALISSRPSQSPLTRKLAEIDLDHDLIAVVALDGFQDEATGLLRMLADETQSAELGGMSDLPKHAKSAVVALDLSGDKLLEITLEGNNAASAERLEGGLDNLFDAAESFAMAIPADNPVQGLIKQLLQGARLATNGSDVVVTFAMPSGIADFVSNEAEVAIAELAELTEQRGGSTPRHDPDLPSESESSDKPKVAVYRDPPKDHPEFRDLAVESHDCRVFFPGKPEFTEQVVKIDEGSVHVANFQGRTPRATYLFEIYTYPRAFVEKTGSKALLEQTRTNLVDAPPGRLISSKSINYQDSPGIEFEYEHPDTTGAGKGHCRVVMRGNRVYVLEVDGFKVPPAEIAVFHDSLAPYALPSNSSPDTGLPPIVETPRLPVPDEAARDKALQLVRELYEKEFRTAKTPTEKTGLAESMIARATEVEAAADRYVLLDVARKMAAGAGGVDAVLNAVAQLDEFEVDTLQLTSESLVELSKSTLTAENRLRVAKEMLDTAGLAEETDRYEFAVGLLQEAATSARKARDLKLAKTAADRLDETTQLKSRYEEIKPALDTLKANPNDAAANQAAGQFYCLLKGQWDVGLPLLAKGDDAKFKTLAEQDLANPKTTDERMKLADRWFELAHAGEGLSEKHLQLRAAFWYRQALPNLNGLQRETVEKRVSQMKYVAEAAGPNVVFLIDVPMLGAEGVLINDDKGHFRDERLKGEKYPQVLWAHPQDKVPSHYAFTLKRKYSKLTGKAAINDVQSVAQAQKPQLFAIYGDKRLLWKSRPLQKKLDSDEFSVNVSNVGTLHLYVAGGGYGGHALWVDVVLEEKR